MGIVRVAFRAVSAGKIARGENHVGRGVDEQGCRFGKQLITYAVAAREDREILPLDQSRCAQLVKERYIV